MDKTKEPEQFLEYPLHPVWWTEQYNSGWERVREALKRDWEQTKGDLYSGSETGRNLRQTATHTIKQALGLESMPLPHQPNPREESQERSEGADRDK